jgi:hypothetical protein
MQSNDSIEYHKNLLKWEWSELFHKNKLTTHSTVLAPCAGQYLRACVQFWHIFLDHVNYGCFHCQNHSPELYTARLSTCHIPIFESVYLPLLAYRCLRTNCLLT